MRHSSAHSRTLGRAGYGFIFIGLLASLTLSTGCSTVGHVVDPLNLRGLGKPPIRVGITKLEFSPPPLFLVPKQSLLNDNLAFHLDEPVCFDLMTPRQIRVHLGTGRLHFAMLSPGDFAEVSPADTYEVLAVAKDLNGGTARRGLIVAAPKSPLHALGELKKLRFHFLPPNDPLNDAALGNLLEAGIQKADLDKGLLGLELDTYHLSSLESAKSVALDPQSAGVIDEADYEKWPNTGGNLLLLIPSQDQVRIIARTVAVPAGPFLASKQNPPELTRKVKDYLLNVVGKRKLVLAPLGLDGFAEPLDIKLYEPFFDIYRKLHPPEIIPETEESAGPETPPQETAPAK